jgi:glucan phosphoethanolaminetransferase (alkaline phosphatase superfamily)
MTTATIPLPAPPSTPTAARTIFWAGLACGVLDILAAFTAAMLNHGTPVRVLHSVSSALLGRRAFDGGVTTAALGLFMHFGIAFVVAAVFYALSRKFPVLLKAWAIPAGLIYGAVVYCTMYWAVIPLAALFRSLYLPDVTVRLPPFSAQALIIHFLFVGLPVALIVRHFSRAASPH